MSAACTCTGSPRAALALALALACGSCAPGWTSTGVASPSGERDARAPRPAAFRREPPPPARRTDEVDVLLEASSGAPALEVERGGSVLRLARSGDGVVASDGRSGPWVLVESAPDGLGVDGRRYSGALLVRADRAHADGGLVVVSRVGLEDYVRGVVAAELAIWSAPPALLEAQAIAARSYARAQLAGRPGMPARPTLSDTTRDQAYRGEYVATGGAGSAAVAARLAEAVERTRGVVLTLDGRVLDARFHACCGGTTAAFGGVFDEPDPGAMTPVPCPPCRRLAGAGATWTLSADPAELARAADVGTHVERLLPVARDEAGRWTEVHLVGDAASRNVSGTELRRLLGWTRLKSAWITDLRPGPGRPVPRGAALVFSGRGRGHGVGLCQTGARALAEEGRSAAGILGHYFPTAALSRLVARVP